jgi:hypothetical protein
MGHMVTCRDPKWKTTGSWTFHLWKENRQHREDSERHNDSSRTNVQSLWKESNVKSRNPRQLLDESYSFQKRGMTVIAKKDKETLTESEGVISR